MDTVESQCREAADALKSLVVAKRVVERLGEFRLVKRSSLDALEQDGDLSKSAVMRVVESRAKVPDPDAVWESVAEEVEREWREHRFALVPGARLLDRVFSQHGGLRYKKVRDGQALARHVDPPEGLRVAITTFLTRDVHQRRA